MEVPLVSNVKNIVNYQFTQNDQIVKQIHILICV